MSGRKLKPGWGHSSISKALALQEWGSRLDPKNMLFFRGGRLSQQCTLGVLVLGTWGRARLDPGAHQPASLVWLASERLCFTKQSGSAQGTVPKAFLWLTHTYTHIHVCPHTRTYAHVHMHKHRKVRTLKPVILPPWILKFREGRWHQRQKAAASIPTVHRLLRSPSCKAWYLEIRRLATVAKR